jgi:hypothetical protein
MYQFSTTANPQDAEAIWATVSIALSEQGIKEINSISGSKIYRIKNANNITVETQSSERNSGEPETIYKTDFIDFIKILKKHTKFNTNSVKQDLPSSIYRKRSPMFAILLALAIIVK